MQNRRGLAALVRTLLTGAASTLVALAAVQPATAAELVTIQNFGSGMCIQPPPGSPTSVGVQLVQEPCNGSAAQKWARNSLGGNNYQFVNASTGGCLDAHGPNADRTPVDTWPCSTISNQRWSVPTAIPNALPTRVVSAIGGRCLDVSAGSLRPDAAIQIYHCTNDNTAQAWFIHVAGCRAAGAAAGPDGAARTPTVRSRSTRGCRSWPVTLGLTPWSAASTLGR